jgi:hypothetical protein
MGAWGSSTWVCARSDGPGVWGPTPLTDAGALDQPCLLESLEVESDAVGMQVEPLGELHGPGWTLELAQEREQPRSGRLREDVIGVGDDRKFDHPHSFAQSDYKKQSRAC